MEGFLKSDSVLGQVQYLMEDPRFMTEKPYYLHFDYDYDLPSTNTSENNKQLVIHNARTIQLGSNRMFEMYGFAKMQLTCRLRYEEYLDPDRVVEVLYPHCIDIVRSLFPSAAAIKVLEHGVCTR